LNKESQKKAPLYEALSKYADEDITNFDVPGHKKRNNPEIVSAFGERVLKLDANSTPDLDMLGHPTGVILQAEYLLADAYGADHAFLLVNGSTSGVQYMILTACSPKDKIIMPRNVHKSAINALIMSGAQPAFIQPETDYNFGIMNGVRFESVREAIERHPDAKAVFLINPTYFGASSDISAIVRLAHSHKMTVLVDESHGAHFPFHPDLPMSAMESGADMATISIHKTGGSLTQTSALLLNERYYNRFNVRTVINLFQTTSASYILMASIDLARRKLALEGRQIFGKLLREIHEAKEVIAAIPGLEVLSSKNINGAGIYDYDETKIVVRVNSLGLTGFKVYSILKNEYNLQTELAETYVVLFIASIGDDAGTLKKLTDSLADISRRFYGQPEFHVEMHNMLEKPRAVISPREAYFAEKCTVKLDEAVGKVCGESIMIYPPGIPIAVPGERLTREIIDHYKFYKSQDCVVINDEENSDYVTVLGHKIHGGTTMLDLWYSEYHADDVKFSIKVIKQIYSEKTPFQQIDFFESETFGTFFTIDGLMMVTQRDEFAYHDMICHVPMAVNPDAKRVLIIGGGDGGTAREVCRYKTVEHIDLVDIDERVIRLCQQFLPQTACQLDRDPRITMYFEDGLKFVREAPEGSYDLILVDSTDPVGPGEGLFTAEFYENCLRALTDDGILINQHESPFYESYEHEMLRAHAKLKETFPIAKVYQFHMPTYPSGHWLFGFASKKLDPIRDMQREKWEALGLKTKYYNTDLHIGAFALPSYVREKLENVGE
jgi:spermidine synthase